jgi:hypothetical protein
MKWTTHQKWNRPKINTIMGTIIKSKQKTNITKIITAGHAQHLN